MGRTFRPLRSGGMEVDVPKGAPMPQISFQLASEEICAPSGPSAPSL